MNIDSTDKRRAFGSENHRKDCIIDYAVYFSIDSCI